MRPSWYPWQAGGLIIKSARNGEKRERERDGQRKGILAAPVHLEALPPRVGDQLAGAGASGLLQSRDIASWRQLHHQLADISSSIS